jgi:hypothetical protein
MIEKQSLIKAKARRFSREYESRQAVTFLQRVFGRAATPLKYPHRRMAPLTP